MARSDAVADLSYRWVAMGVVLFGSFMVVLDTTIINLALPGLSEEFEGGLNVEWIVTGYLAAVGVTQMATGWVGDRFGRRATFIWSLLMFTIGSFLCAMAPSLELLVAARVVQGIGGGLLMPIGLAMIYELFEPEDRGKALGIFGISVMAAPAIGPVLGGALASSIGWRWLFLINVPVGLIGFPVAIRLLRDTGYREHRPFDTRGLALAGTGLTALLIGLQQSGDWGWDSPVVLVLVFTGVGLVVWFTLHGLYKPNPLVDMRIFASPTFSIAMAVHALIAIAQYGRLIYIPLELGTTRDVDELTIGFVLLPQAAGIAVMVPLGSRLCDKIGARVPFATGVAVLAISFWPLAHLTPETSLTTISMWLFIGGLGSGFAMMTPNIIALNSVSAQKVSQASGLTTVVRQVTAALGTAMLASIFATISPGGDLTAPDVVDEAVDAYNKVFMTGLIVLIIVFCLSFLLPGKQKALELQRERRAESEAASKAAAVEAAGETQP